MLQLVKKVSSIALSLRLERLAQFVYTPSNASSMRELDLKTELKTQLIKVGYSFLHTP